MPIYRIDKPASTSSNTNEVGIVQTSALPIFHHKTDSIEAHLTVVFTALAVARYLQKRTGVSIKKLVQTLRPLQTVTITIAGEQVTAHPRLTTDAAAILDKIPDLTGH